MGLSGFLSFLKKKVPESLQEGHISEYAYQRVFIDISSVIYRYICSHGKKHDRWITGILQYLLVFRENNVIAVPVFDGKPPEEKGDEIKERREKRHQLQQRITALRDSLEEYEETKKVNTTIEEELTRLQNRKARNVSLLHSNKEIVTNQDIQLLYSSLHTLERQHIVITEEDLNRLKAVFTAFGVSWLQSPSESESFCAFLLRHKEGVAMVSCDSDCLAHLAPRLILELENNGRCIFIDIEDLLRRLQIEPKQMIDYAILMGCDYNKHIKENKLGPVNALKLIQNYRRIEDIPNQMINKECLSYERCRELFEPVFDAVIIKHFSIDTDKMLEFASEWGLTERFLDRWTNRNQDKPESSIVFEE